MVTERNICASGCTISVGLFVGVVGVLAVLSAFQVAWPNLRPVAGWAAAVICLAWVLLAHRGTDPEKRSRRGTLGASLAAGALVGSLIFVLFLYLFGLDTEYAPGYSEAAFESVRIGETREAVVARLGEPLWTFGEEREVLSYTRSPSDSHYLVRMVVLDEKGRVVEKRSEIYWD